MLTDWSTAPINERLRAVLGFLVKLTVEPGAVGAADVEPLRRQGLDDEAVGSALLVCTLFNIIDRIADALDFEVHENQLTASFMP